MDERLLQQLEEMETKLEAFQSALESIEESKELTKESALTLKESQVALSRACEDFIPMLQERFNELATNSVSTQSKIESLLTKLQSLDTHQLSEKIENDRTYFAEQMTIQLAAQNDKLKITINEACNLITKSNEEALERILTGSFSPLDSKLDSIEHNVLKSQNTIAATVEESIAVFENKFAITNDLMESLTTENRNLLSTKLESIESKFEALEIKFKTTQSLIAQVRIIGVATIVACICMATLTIARLFF